MGFFKSLSKYGLIPAVVGGNIITAGLEKVTGKKYGRTTLEEASSTKFGKALGLATLGTGIALAGASAGAGASARALSKLIPKTTLGKMGGLFIGGTALASPLIRESIVEAPFKIVGAGQKVGKKIEELPEETQTKASKFGKAGLIVAGVGALVMAPKIIEKAKDIIPDHAPGLPVSIPEDPGIPTMPLDQPGALNTAILPETVDISPKKRKRRAVKKVSSINFTNKNYLRVNNYL